ncbi:MAG: hypothetical protein ACLTAF_04550 [Blautia coccoides]
MKIDHHDLSRGDTTFITMTTTERSRKNGQPEKAYEHYCEECKWGGVEPESWDEVLRVNQELLQEKKEDQEQLMQYIEAEKAEIK